MQHLVGDPDAGQHAAMGAVFQRQPQRPRPHLHRAGRRLHRIEHDGQRLPLLGRFALDVDELRGMRHRIEHDDEFRRQLQRDQRLLAGRQFQRLHRELVEMLFEVLGQVDA